MDTRSKFFHLLIALIFQGLVVRTRAAPEISESNTSANQSSLKCPNETDSCSCRVGYDTLHLTCKGVLVTQEKIDDLILKTRSANSQSEDDRMPLRPRGLTVSSFEILMTPLVELDISQLPLLSTRVDSFRVWLNENLTRIFSSSTTSSLRIDTKFISLDYNLLSDSGLAETLQLFNPQIPKSLEVSFNRMVGSQQEDAEFIRGLSQFTNLKMILLTGNEIKVLAGGQFRRNRKLAELWLSINPLEKIEEDAFLIDYSNNARDRYGILEERKLQIWLNYCTLSDEKISKSFCGGAEASALKIEIELHGNYFEFLDEDKFRPFLMQNPNNELSFDYESGMQNKQTNLNFTIRKNRFKCDDDRMRWLKAGKAEFTHRVLRLNCMDDPGKTIFETYLV